MVTIIDEKYKPQTQSELIDLYSKKDQLEKEYKDNQDKMSELRKKYLSELSEKNNLLYNQIQSVKEITYFYKDKPIHESNDRDGCGYCVWELKSDHKRRAHWYESYWNVYEESGHYYDGSDCVWKSDDRDFFDSNRLQWVVDGILPE